MKRLISTLVPAVVLTLALAIPAQAGRPRTVRWVCEVPDVGTVIFVTAADRAQDGIETANEHAGETFARQFFENCHVES